jgi:uncharacterized protein (TIGR03083 family)
MLRVTRLARDERADLLDLLGRLTPEQWNAASLCSGWSVRDVAAHVIDYDVAGWSRTVARLRSTSFSLDEANALGETENAHLTADELQRLLALHLWPRGLPSLFGGRIALLDALVHHQDIRRPLGLPRSIPSARLVPALNFARVAFAAGIPRRIQGLSLVAVDLDWKTGRGPRVEGPAEALLMSMAGRSQALADVDGPGVEELARRIEAD